MKLHHVGVAVKSIQTALQTYRTILAGAAPGEPFADPIQEIKGVFVPLAHGCHIEFLEPLSAKSHLKRLADRNAGAYHLGFLVSPFDSVLDGFKAQGWMATNTPQPAIAFGMKRIVFLFSPDGLLIELIEE